MRQRAAVTYFLMTRHVLSLYEHGNLPMLPDLNNAYDDSRQKQPARRNAYPAWNIHSPRSYAIGSSVIQTLKHNGNPANHLDLFLVFPAHPGSIRQGMWNQR